MSYKRSRYSRNNQNWLFYHPTVGDNWTHLIEKEYFAASESYYEDEDTVIEQERQKQTKLGKKNNYLGNGKQYIIIRNSYLVANYQNAKSESKFN